MEEIIAYLNKQGKSSYANQLTVFIEKEESGDGEKKKMEAFIKFVIEEASKKTPRERILFNIIEEARKQKFMR